MVSAIMENEGPWRTSLYKSSVAVPSRGGHNIRFQFTL